MPWSEFLIDGGSSLLSNSEGKVERLCVHGSWSCSLSPRDYYLSAYSDMPRATARPYWQCRELYTDRLPSPRTGKIGRGLGRALQGYAVTCCRSTSAMTQLNAPTIRQRLIPGSPNYRRTPSKT